MKYLVSADHVVARHACVDREFTVRAYHGRFSASAEHYGCSTYYSTPYDAIVGMLQSHACTNIRVRKVEC